MRDARQLGRYGVTVSEPALDYSRLLARVGEVVEDVRSHSSFAQVTRFFRHDHCGLSRRMWTKPRKARR